MRKFNLIQRGTFRDECVNNTNTIGGFFGGGHHNLVDPDYMGSSEFEYGAIPRAYRRFMQKRHDYRLVNLKEEMGLENVNGIPFWVYIHREDYGDFIVAFKDYIADLRDRNKIRSWHLKEATYIERHLDRLTFLGRPEMPRGNFWWCIDIREGYVGDWFLFLGAKDRVNALLHAFEHDYTNWWINLSDEDRNQD